jgi:hypothetical protein
MHTMKRGRAEALIKVGLDLDALAADAMRLEPVDFGASDVAFRLEANERDAFELTPATFAISFREVPKDVNASPDCDDFDFGDLANNLELHAGGFYLGAT